MGLAGPTSGAAASGVVVVVDRMGASSNAAHGATRATGRTSASAVTGQSLVGADCGEAIPAVIARESGPGATPPPAAQFGARDSTRASATCLMGWVGCVALRTDTLSDGNA